MPLKPGTVAPDFKLPDTQGQTFHLYEVLKESPVIVFFYPKSFTPGCTKEVCSFRDDYSFFSKRNIRLVGISHDGLGAQKSFQEAYHLPYPLLSDTQKIVTKLYDASWLLDFLVRRTTYLIGQDLKIKSVYDNVLQPTRHLEAMKAALPA